MFHVEHSGQCLWWFLEKVVVQNVDLGWFDDGYFAVFCTTKIAGGFVLRLWRVVTGIP